MLKHSSKFSDCAFNFSWIFALARDSANQAARHTAGETVGIWVNTLRLRQSCSHFADGIFKCIFSNENVWISLKISLKFVPMVQINNIAVLVQIMTWRQPGDKPLSQPMMVSLLMHICITRPQWIKLKLVGSKGETQYITNWFHPGISKTFYGNISSDNTC